MDKELTLRAPARVLDTNLVTKGGDVAKTEQLTMTRERCLNRELIDSFFGILRHNSDDVIRQKLNNMNNLGAKAKTANCQKFVHEELFPSWGLREAAIRYCEREAQSLKQELDAKYGNSPQLQQPVLDARVDPYAAADNFLQSEAHYKEWKELIRWTETQRKIESILQKNGSNVLNRACDPDTTYIEEFEKFRKNLK